jgi:hypothetical protein
VNNGIPVAADSNHVTFYNGISIITFVPLLLPSASFKSMIFTSVLV